MASKANRDLGEAAASPEAARMLQTQKLLSGCYQALRTMTTITSPRPSLSTSSPTSSRTASPAPNPTRTRANRAALRDYYGIKTSAPADATTHDSVQSPTEEQSDVRTSELDAEGFDAGAYVRNILATQSLESVLKIESALISEIKSLDGEKKALVYDNYSKLIAATDTIRSMRDNMGPLTPANSTLSPAVAHIAATTAALATAPAAGSKGGSEIEDRVRKRKQRETVRWVLDAPKRLGRLLDGEKRVEAEKDWSEIKGLLDKWEGVRGVEEVRAECEKVMGGA